MLDGCCGRWLTRRWPRSKQKLRRTWSALRRGSQRQVVAAASIPTDRYYGEGEVLSAALGELIGKGALVYDYETSYLMAGRPESPEAYKITQRGIDLLREAGE